ncbi:hypothetical protein BDZ89DRAFT_1193325 [Hymenopellis radicata]|nr:hypothetical protein BDZ89DRAFT_1193325 [Hymenopellis radicata]
MSGRTSMRIFRGSTSPYHKACLYARITSPRGDVPLCQLSLLPDTPLPPLRYRSPLGYDLNLSDVVLFSPSYTAPVFPIDLNRNDFVLGLLPGNFFSQCAASEWDSFADPIITAPKIHSRRYVAPGSPESICSSPELVLHLFQPQPKSGIEIDLIELEAMAADVEVESKETDEGFWRSCSASGNEYEYEYELGLMIIKKRSTLQFRTTTSFIPGISIT